MTPWTTACQASPSFTTIREAPSHIVLVVVSSLSHVDSWDPMDCSLPGSSVHVILQARILEWVAISFSRGSNLHLLCLSCIVDGFFACLAIGEACSPYTDNVWSESRNKIITSLETKFSLIPLNTSQKEAWWIFCPPCLIKEGIPGHQGFTFSFSSFGQKNNLLVKIYYNKKYIARDNMWFDVAQQGKSPSNNWQQPQTNDSVPLSVSSKLLSPLYAQSYMSTGTPFSFHFHLLLLFLSFEGTAH